MNQTSCLQTEAVARKREVAEALEKLSACEAAAAALRGELGSTKAALAQLASQHQSLVHILAKRPDVMHEIARHF